MKKIYVYEREDLVTITKIDWARIEALTTDIKTLRQHGKDAPAAAIERQINALRHSRGKVVTVLRDQRCENNYVYVTIEGEIVPISTSCIRLKRK